MIFSLFYLKLSKHTFLIFQLVKLLFNKNLLYYLAFRLLQAEFLFFKFDEFIYFTLNMEIFISIIKNTFFNTLN